MDSTEPDAATNPTVEEQTGVADVRHVREAIAKEHAGDLADHVARTNRIAEEVRHRIRLGCIVLPSDLPQQGDAGHP